MAAASPRRARDSSLDSLGGVLIVAVVLGHAVAMLPGHIGGSVQLFIYFFHMPAFVWLSGFLTQYSRKWSVGQLVAKLLFPLIVFQVIQRIFVAAWYDSDIVVRLPSIGWTLWYLFALFVWRLLAPILMRSRWNIPLSIVVAIVAGMVPFIGYGYSLGRILGFLPFFVIGLFWRREWMDVLRRFWWLGVLIFALAAALALKIEGTGGVGPWLMALSYDRMDITNLHGAVERSAVLALAMLLILALISVAYRKLPIFSSIGVATLPVYLIHSLVLMPWHLDGMDIGVKGTVAVAVLTVGSVALAWLASRPLVVRAIRPLSDFTWWSQRFGVGTAHERTLEFHRDSR